MFRTLTGRLLFNLYSTVGKECRGEPISQVSHALQTYHNAYRYVLPVRASGFLHDIDRLYPDIKEEDHGYIGAQICHALGFDSRVCSLIAYHTSAKAYLVCKDAKYENTLNDVSLSTLRIQFKKMDGDIYDFLSPKYSDYRLRKYAVMMRRIEDHSKKEDYKFNEDDLIRCIRDIENCVVSRVDKESEYYDYLAKLNP